MKTNNYIQPVVEVTTLKAIYSVCAVSQTAPLDFGGAATGTGTGGNNISPEQGL